MSCETGRAQLTAHKVAPTKGLATAEGGPLCLPCPQVSPDLISKSQNTPEWPPTEVLALLRLLGLLTSLRRLVLASPSGGMGERL